MVNKKPQRSERKSNPSWPSRWIWFTWRFQVALHSREPFERTFQVLSTCRCADFISILTSGMNFGWQGRLVLVVEDLQVVPLSTIKNKQADWKRVFRNGLLISQLGVDGSELPSPKFIYLPGSSSAPVLYPNSKILSGVVLSTFLGCLYADINDVANNQLNQEITKDIQSSGHYS
jgi:hypothetical protein